MIQSTHRFLLAAAIASLGLGACMTGGAPGELATEPRTPTEQHAIEVDRRPEEIRLKVHAAGLSPNQDAAAARFVDGWREADGGEIVIQAPNGAGDPAAVHRMVEGLRHLLAGTGVPREAVRIVGYDARGQATPPLIVGYDRYVALGPQCGENWASITRSANNRVHPNFGCAVTANMAAQIANPRDLIEPRGFEPADAGRRQATLEKYRAGEATGAKAAEESDGAIATAVE
jgi:pilus assembly protein CpaD